MASSGPGKKPDHVETVVPFHTEPSRITPLRSVRSTLVAASLRALRERSLFERYITYLDARYHATVLGAVAGVWLPSDVGLAHYRACDALALSAAEHVAIGRDVGDRVQGTMLGTMVRAAKNAGVTPWVALSYTGKLYERLFEGGDCCVLKLGPKDARVHVEKNALYSVAYFRNACRGMFEVAIELFCRKAYVHEVRTAAPDVEFVARISWA